MQQWTQQEKRRAPRFEIDIPIATFTSPFIQIRSKVLDISAYGIGAVVAQPLAIGTELDLVFMLPDQEDRVRLKSKVIWVRSMSNPEHYRIGTRFFCDNFNPIPYVLKTLQQKAISRPSINHPYPA
jgi:hypothetical protein